MLPKSSEVNTSSAVPINSNGANENLGATLVTWVQGRVMMTE